MASLRVKIGASADQRSFDVVFGQLEKRGVRATQVMAKQFAQLFKLVEMRGDKAAAHIGKAMGGIGPRGVRGKASDYARPAIEGAKKATAAISHEARKRIAFEKALMLAQNRERLRAIEREKREEIAAIRRVASERRRQTRLETRERQKFADRTSHRTTRFLTPNAPIGSMAARAVGDIARGAGVNWNLSSLVGTVVQQEKLATDLSNMGYQPNAPEGDPNRTRVDPRDLVKETRQSTSKYGIATAEGLNALNEYAAIAGNLHGARAALGELAQLSAATGSNLADMAAAAGNVDMQLGDIPDKAKVVSEVMRVIAGQGKLGGVEIKDMATHMARVASAAGSFEGDRAENIVKMGALAQISRGKGGSPSAAEAARSTVGFANTMKKGARLKAFDAMGIDVYNENDQLRDPFEIIKDSLAATKGDPRQMNKLFMDVIGARAIAGLSDTYNRAGKGEAGLDAVDKMLNRFVEQAKISDEELAESSRRASESTAAKAERFNAKLEEIVETAATDLIPAFEKAAPTILKFAELMGDAVHMLVEQPAKALVIAAGAALTRAGLESALRAGIERMIMGSPGALAGGAGSGAVVAGGSGSGGRGRGGRVMAGAGMAMNGLLLAGAAWTIKELIVEHAVMKELEADAARKDKREQEAKKVEDTYKRVVEEGMTEEQAKTALGDRGARAARGEMNREDFAKLEEAEAGRRGGEDAVDQFLKLEQAREAQNAELQAALGKENKALAAALAGIQTGTLKVRVVNPGDIGGGPGGGGAPPAGRASVPMPGPAPGG